MQVAQSVHKLLALCQGQTSPPVSPTAVSSPLGTGEGERSRAIPEDRRPPQQADGRGRGAWERQPHPLWQEGKGETQHLSGEERTREGNKDTPILLKQGDNSLPRERCKPHSQHSA